MVGALLELLTSVCRRRGRKPSMLGIWIVFLLCSPSSVCYALPKNFVVVNG